MYAGRVVETAQTQDLFDAPRHHYTTGLLGAVPTAGRRAAEGRLQEIPGLVPVLSVQPDACTFADRCPAATERCRTSRPPLAPEEDAERSVHRFACWHPNDGVEAR
jgi:peptide/nickel transport system ATP-binding protein